MKLYVVYNKVHNGYLSEDSKGRLVYKSKIGHPTVYFFSENFALENCDENEIVVEVDE